MINLVIEDRGIAMAKLKDTSTILADRARQHRVEALRLIAASVIVADKVLELCPLSGNQVFLDGYAAVRTALKNIHDLQDLEKAQMAIARETTAKQNACSRELIEFLANPVNFGLIMLKHIDGQLSGIPRLEISTLADDIGTIAPQLLIQYARDDSGTIENILCDRISIIEVSLP